MDLGEFALKHIHQMPHCDQRVLHSPEDNCKYCNERPEWQAVRIMWGIAFTGRSYDDKGRPSKGPHGNVLQPCPAEAERGMESLNGWHGNVPMTPEAEKAFDDFWVQRKKDIEDMTGESET